MTKAVIFDIFGVLMSSVFDNVKRDLSFTAEQYAEAGKVDDLVDLGKISATERDERVAKIAGVDLQVIIDKKNYYDNARHANEELFAEITKLRQTGYKTAIISNISAYFISELDFLSPEKSPEHFDVVTLSSQVGLIKPNPEIFVLTAEKLGIKPEECIFVDDREVNVIGAKKAGMRGVIYENIEQFKSDLNKLLKE